MQLTSVQLPLVSRIPSRIGRLREAPGIKHWFPVRGVLPSLKSSILVSLLPSYPHSQFLNCYLPFILQSQPMHFYFHYIYKPQVLSALNLDVESGSPHPSRGWKAEPRGFCQVFLVSRGWPVS